MATAMDRHGSHHVMTRRTSTQKVCIGVGIFFILAGLGGIVMPGMLNLHLSTSHNLIHLASGALALWSGYADDSRKAYNFSIGFGVVYGLLGLAGFIFGEPGYPGVGHMAADENLMRVIPNALEFGTMDHGLHLLLSAILIGSAYAWKNRRDDVGKRKLPLEERYAKDLLNSQSNLKDANLGRSDINRKSDLHRRSDFERRI